MQSVTLDVTLDTPPYEPKYEWYQSIVSPFPFGSPTHRITSTRLPKLDIGGLP
jgi:hypothetical protein